MMEMGHKNKHTKWPQTNQKERNGDSHDMIHGDFILLPKEGLPSIFTISMRIPITKLVLLEPINPLKGVTHHLLLWLTPRETKIHLALCDLSYVKDPGEMTHVYKLFKSIMSNYDNANLRVCHF